MGMNIYTLNGVHIGKRFANGIWCWDCKKKVKIEKRQICDMLMDVPASPFTCPSCGKVRKKVGYCSAYRELGFDKTESKKHSGVDGASGFTWQIGSYGLGNTIEEVKEKLEKRRYVKTEYGERWKMKKFWQMFLDVIEEKEEKGEFS